MRFTRRVLADVPDCYAVSTLPMAGGPRLLFASEGRGPCLSYTLPGFEKETVWDAPGGTMSMIPLEGREGEFLAVQDFFPVFDAAHSKIVRVRKAGGGWRVSPLAELPYVHRFDVLRRAGISYLVGCTLCSAKAYTEDWSSPGGLYAGVLPDDPARPVELAPIKTGMTKNHGWCRKAWDGYTEGYAACSEGVFRVIPPASPEDAWDIRQVIQGEVSDLAFCDIDGDGVEEVAVIRGFHGGVFEIIKPDGAGWETLYTYTGKPREFCHVAWGGRLRGRPAFIGGYRRQEMELFVVTFEGGAFKTEVIETGGGPANVAVLNGPDRDVILVANRDSQQAVVHLVED